jgi:molybdenum cofactor cytidylyltransferase
MGRPKLALPLGGRSVLEWVVAALQGAGVQQIVVVVGPHVSELVRLAECAGAAVCQLDHETPDMRATVERGLLWLEERFHPGPAARWLLVPADHPLLDGRVVQQLLAARAANPDRSIILPTFQERRGHPVLIDWRHVEPIRRLPAGQGLNRYLRQCVAETFEVPVADAGILCDLDTPTDYEQLRRCWRSPAEGTGDIGGRVPPDYPARG